MVTTAHVTGREFPRPAAQSRSLVEPPTAPARARPHPSPTGLGCQSLITGEFSMRSLQPAEWNFVIALALLAVLAIVVVLMLPDFTGR
jgi:hypothetical protein